MAPIFDRINQHSLPLASTIYSSGNDKPLAEQVSASPPAILIGRTYTAPAYPSLQSVTRERSPHPRYHLPQPQVFELIHEKAVKSSYDGGSVDLASISTPPAPHEIIELSSGTSVTQSADESDKEEYRERPLGLRRLKVIKPKPPQAPENTPKKAKPAARLGKGSGTSEKAEGSSTPIHPDRVFSLNIPLSLGSSTDGGEVLGMSPLGLLKKERVLMCGLSPPGMPHITCGIYATHFHDLYRHRIVHMMWETLLRERAEIAGEQQDLSGFVFGGFVGDFPKCDMCDKRFSRYDSLQRHKLKTTCQVLSANGRTNQIIRRQRLDKEVRKSEALQHWIETPVPRPKVALAKVAYPSGTRAYRDVVILEIYEVEETYAPRYQVVTVKGGKEYQVKLFNHDEPGGVQFYTKQDENVQLKATAMAEWTAEDHRALNARAGGSRWIPA
ncbi:hypothetical protein CALVIDRAFT_567086 [Calocera viscosa TUFC12733]|uniref:Uncharacterized protein n=1 Tax=Calocera viscosa (strain TUFC12733) TaxID=1330018 RepID=A0A167IMK7_CALVF|nr:hypothetical protein CALVIDRAFT_567086 [Calocera viscosa TUFC12733]